MFPFKLHRQTLQHAPMHGVNGNCQQTVIACLLNKEIDEVPHFAEGLDFSRAKESGETFNQRIADYLATQNLQEFLLAYEGMSLKDVLKTTSGQNPKVPMIIGVRGSRSVNHSVIAYGGVIVHDPHGPVQEDYEPLDCGHCDQYHVSILVPTQFGEV